MVIGFFPGSSGKQAQLTFENSPAVASLDAELGAVGKGEKVTAELY